MKRYLETHEDWVLGSLGILLLGLIVVFIVWSIARISKPVGAALNAGSQRASKIQFNIDELKKTNLRGIALPE